MNSNKSLSYRFIEITGYFLNVNNITEKLREDIFQQMKYYYN